MVKLMSNNRTAEYRSKSGSRNAQAEVDADTYAKLVEAAEMDETPIAQVVRNAIQEHLHALRHRLGRFRRAKRDLADMNLTPNQND